MYMPRFNLAKDDLFNNSRYHLSRPLMYIPYSFLHLGSESIVTCLGVWGLIIFVYACLDSCQKQVLKKPLQTR